ncbi:DUF1109 domain-containing protein [Sphingomonas ginsenosidivorax]|uniref:DUF1109 domain-containing protein n=1 Tax=Sphingomonas ginsenosidivorax TaxID=862135 RepID=A0A5C6UJ14_9SPHN|nr:DUF1109 domain-containing protein [Sphingomonas ginsenosidivorax]TXC72221.1 DUF1109 domain-containing protein [Sphingomonas ginsenosidivorax]
MLNDVFLDELASSLTPVRRRSVRRETGMLVGLGALELALFLGIGAMRPDMGQAIGLPFMWWKLGSLALIVAISVHTAVRSFSPTVSPRPGLILLTGVIGLAAIMGAVVSPGLSAGGTILERLSPAHGLVCMAAIVVLSLPMLGMLAILMRRGASTHAEGSALAVGVAGGSWGAFVFAFCCPANDPLYVLIWYCAGCAAVTLTSRLILPKYSTL